MDAAQVVSAAVLLCVAAQAVLAAPDRKTEYVNAVVRGAGFMPWQERGVAPEEVEFRKQIEARKDRMLAERVPVEHPIMLTEGEIAQAKRNMQTASWARSRIGRHKAIADYVVAQPKGWVEQMIPEQTPWFGYGLTCPNCVHKKSQEGQGDSVMGWSYRKPDVLTCRFCKQTYPDPKFPESAKLVCPRSGEVFTFYLNDEQRRHPDNRTGKYAWRWVGHPMHMSFTGVIRERKVLYMAKVAKSLAIAYRFNDDPRYAAKAIRVLTRLAHGYRRWLYHDYWGGVADSDPMYAAWHWQELRLVWKRHLCTDVFRKDKLDKARMLQSYWGAGRVHPSCDMAQYLAQLSLAYDLVHDAAGPDGKPLWTPETRSQVERDLLMEWLMGAEPFLGGAGKADNVNNKSGRVYFPMAAVAKCLGITEWADTALRGFEGLEEKSLTYDGFSHESPAYTFSGASYLGTMLRLAEALHGFRWPKDFAKRTGDVDLYRDAKRFGLLMRTQVECLVPDGRFPPLSDTPVRMKPGLTFVETGLKRMPDVYAGALAAIHPNATPSEFAALHLDAEDIESARQDKRGLRLPELYFPAWMTAFLRHGHGSDAAMLSLHFPPLGGHRHSDNLALYYFSHGRAVLGDHGYIGDTPMNKWIRHTFSHNLVVVDDKPQIRRKPDRVPRLHMMATSPRASVVEASSKAYTQCSEYRRLVALIKGPASDTFAVDVFRVKGGKRHAFRVFSEIAASDADEGKLRFEGVTLPPEPPLPQVGASTKKEDIFGLRDVRRAADPKPGWRAVWREKGAAYRLWVLSPVQAVHAYNGPGQETRREHGRRVRYVDAVRQGDDLASTFVAIHEPCDAAGKLPIRAASLIELPLAAGPNAVAVRIESAWGTHWVFSQFESEVTVDGIRFEGDFGAFCRSAKSEHWLMAVGASTLKHERLGFEGQAAKWKGKVVENTDTVITTSTPRPAGWPVRPEWCQGYVLAHDGAHETGFPVQSTGPKSITVRRFPLPKLTTFELPAVRFASVAEAR